MTARKLIIAIDCDDVLVPSTKKIVDIYNQQYNTTVSYERSHESGNEEWAASRDEVIGRIVEVQSTDEYAEVTPYPEAIAAIERLLAAGHELHMVTARDEKLLAVTEKMLIAHFPQGAFTSLQHIGADITKGDICAQLRADVLIDDNLKHIVDAGEYGVEGLWFGDYPWQSSGHQVETDSVVRCLSWGDVERAVGQIASNQTGTAV